MPYKDPEKQREAQRKSYDKHRDKVRERRQEKKRAVWNWLVELKSQPCLDCGETYPYYVMQFDHVRGEKVGGINSLYKSNSLRLVREEVEKCEVVCANCHAERTWNRAQALANGFGAEPPKFG